MSDTTSTATAPATDPTPNDDSQLGELSGFGLTLFGAVEVREVRSDDVHLTDDERKAFAAMLGYFSARSNRARLSPTFGTEEEAKLFARKLNTYAGANNLSVTPKREGTTVTFRFAKSRETSKNGEVTVTAGTPKAATPPSRGHEVLAK